MAGGRQAAGHRHGRGGASWSARARALITTWADRAAADGQLSNYANRDWHGLIGEVHVPQWQAYLDELADALAAGRAPKAFDWYRGGGAVDPGPHAPIRCGRRATRTAPRGGSTTPSPPPPTRAPSPSPRTRRAFTPGGTGTVTAAFRNVNGLRATGRVDFALTGLDADRRARPRCRAVPAGGTGTVAWRVTAPPEPLTEPLRPLPYELAVSTGRGAQQRVCGHAEGHACTWRRRWIPGWRTFTSNAAVFGQLGDRFAINGAGTDLWKGTAEFGTAYREGALADGVASVTVGWTPRTPPAPGPGPASSSATAWRRPGWRRASSIWP